MPPDISSVSGRYLTIRGSTLRIDERGPESGPPLLYVHGGPGQGCYDFMSYQGDRLSSNLRLVGVDQRGVLLSAPIPDGSSLSEQDLIDDFEGIREALEIEHWAVLSHSYGGRLALRYAVRHPLSISAVVFENPMWDFELTARARLEAALPIFDEIRQVKTAAEVRKLLESAIPATIGSWELVRELLGRLGSRYMDMYVSQADVRARLPEFFPADRLGHEIRLRGARQTTLLAQSPQFYESLLPLLDQLFQPALLCWGAHDPVTSTAAVEAFRSRAPHGRVVVFGRSSHFVQFEEADAFAETVRDFVMSNGP